MLFYTNKQKILMASSDKYVTEHKLCSFLRHFNGVRWMYICVIIFLTLLSKRPINRTGLMGRLSLWLLMFSCTLYCILISYIMNKFLFKPTALGHLWTNPTFKILLCQLTYTISNREVCKPRAGWLYLLYSKQFAKHPLKNTALKKKKMKMLLAYW